MKPILCVVLAVWIGAAARGAGVEAATAQPGDRLMLHAFGIVEWDGAASLVSAAGNVQLPFGDVVPVAGKTRERIREELLPIARRYYQNCDVTVEIEKGYEPNLPAVAEPGVHVRIRSHALKEWNGDLMVSATGNIQLLLAGEVAVGGKSAEEIRGVLGEINKKLGLVREAGEWTVELHRPRTAKAAAPGGLGTPGVPGPAAANPRVSRTVGGATAGVGGLALLAAVLARGGRYRRVSDWLLRVDLGVGIVLMAGASAAMMLGRQWSEWSPLYIPGMIAVLLGALLPVAVHRVYEKNELRRMSALDAA